VAKKSLLPRGFKAEAERTAVRLRKELELEPHSPLCGFELAKHLKITVHTAPDYFGAEVDISPLVGTKVKDSGWSALTMKKANNERIIIHNHLHAASRQQSDLMHELAHIICDHQPPDSHKNINLPDFMRGFDPQQEEEAKSLGAALQISREGLVWALKNHMDTDQIAEHFNASAAMVKLRINSTGVKQQLSYLNR
jgi:Zn-dependent peptidase ImmA (M78 family)